jgi:hypothetical protein
MRTTWVAAISLVVLGCGLDETTYKKQHDNTTTLAITNAEGEQDVLRTGTSLSVALGSDLQLKANTVYRLTVTNTATQSLVSQADLLSDSLGMLEITTVAHDLGENDGVGERDTLQVRLSAPDGASVADTMVELTPHAYGYVGHGFTVNEIQPPHVFSCDGAGTPVNAYVVGALPDAGETAAPIYVAGTGFPPNVTTVDLYIARDRDAWKGKAIPRHGEADFIAGPIVGTVVNGELKPVAVTDWKPAGKDLGPYDVLVDVDRNGTFDYSFSAKDGADGENKVGLTIQYGARWFRAKAASTAATLSVAAAQAAATAADQAASKAEAAAVNGGANAQALAQQARTAANNAKAQLTLAQTASGKADAAFNQSLADDTTAQSEAGKADAAAKSAANFAQTAAQLIAATEAAAAAYKAAMVAEWQGKHVLVNLAFDSSSRSGSWKNTYTTSSKIYSYVNPPVQHGARHAFVTKLVIYHQDWSKFWNNADKLIQGNGKLYIADKVVQATGGTVQKSCTNSPPVAIINPIDLPVDIGDKVKFDVVFAYANDGYYVPGRDILDVVGNSTGGDLVSPVEISKLADADIYGFAVTK